MAAIGFVEEFSDLLRRMDTNDIVAVMVDTGAGRRVLHDFIDFEAPKLGHISIICPGLLNSGKVVPVMKKCYNCDTHSVKLSTYTYGYMENNQDESYWGVCKCGDHCRWEPNYDDRDSVVYVAERNIMLIGAIFATIPHKKWDISKTSREEHIQRIKAIQGEELTRVKLFHLPVETYEELTEIKRNTKRLPEFIRKLLPQSWSIN